MTTVKNKLNSSPHNKLAVYETTSSYQNLYSTSQTVVKECAENTLDSYKTSVYDSNPCPHISLCKYNEGKLQELRQLLQNLKGSTPENVNKLRNLQPDQIATFDPQNQELIKQLQQMAFALSVTLDLSTLSANRTAKSNNLH